MALTDVKVCSAKPTDKAFKLTDGEGKHLMVHPNGSKYWRLQYRFDSQQKMLALGVYPEVTLSKARQRRDEAKRKIANQICSLPSPVSARTSCFLRALAAYSGSPITRLATKILMLTGVRTVELRMAEWEEFDFDKRVWEVPVERVKMRRPHLVPLPDQVVAALREILNIVPPVLTMGA